MSARIDIGTVLRLVATRFDTLAAGTPPIGVRHLGEPDPPAGADVWVRQLEPVLAAIQRVRGSGEPDMMDIDVSFAVFCSENQNSRYAIGTAASLLRAAFEGETLHDPALPAATVHQIDFTHSRVEITNIAEEERRIRVGLVSFSGTVVRFSGTSITSHLNP